MLRAALFLCASLALVAGLCSSASAHGRPTAAIGVAFHPDDDDVIVIRTTKGLIVTRDGGASWHWICLEVLAAETFGNEDPPLDVLSNGAMLASSGIQGVLRSDPTWCGWSEVDLPTDTPWFIIDQARHPTQGSTAFVLTSSGSPTENLVYRTDDNGQTFQPTSDPIDAVLFESIAIAPSNPNVMYLTAVYFVGPTRMASVYRSGDGGDSWGTPVNVPLLANEVRPVVLGVDPTDPDRIFLGVFHSDTGNTHPAERVLLSENGGASFAEVHQAPHVRSFAISDDGETVWVGNSSGGFYRSDNGGETFDVLDATLQVHCLGWHDGQLVLCGDELQFGQPDFMVGTSSNLGETFEPFFTIAELDGILPCDFCAGSTIVEECGWAACDALAEFEIEPTDIVPELACMDGAPTKTGVPDDLECPDGGVPGGDGGPDGGIGTDGGPIDPDAGTDDPGDDGCGCTAVGLSSRAPGAALLFVLLAAVALLRRRSA